jgi:hypothetical protein
MNFITLYLPPSIQITDDQFFEMCQINELIKIERNADGSVKLQPLLGGVFSNTNASLTVQIVVKNTEV